MQAERIYEDIKLKPCPMCGGLPMMLVMRQCMDSIVSIQCSECGTRTGGVSFANRRAQKELLPDLATARRQVTQAWNERTGEHGDQPTERAAQVWPADP